MWQGVSKAIFFPNSKNNERNKEIKVFGARNGLKSLE